MSVEFNIPEVALDCKVGTAATSEINAAVASRETPSKIILEYM
jgi:hypothetical protein